MQNENTNDELQECDELIQVVIEELKEGVNK